MIVLADPRSPCPPLSTRVPTLVPHRIKARLEEAMERAYEEALSATESTPKVESVLRFHVAAGDVTHMMEVCCTARWTKCLL